MKAWLRKLHERSPAVRRWVRRYRARFAGYPDWERILGTDRARWESALAAAKAGGGPKILLATNVGAFLPGAGIESLLAVALTLRGAEVHVLLCDAALPACLEARYGWHPDPANLARRGITADLCADCFAPAFRMFRSLGLTVHRLGELLTEDERRSAPAEAREHALAGTLRFYARGTLEGEPEAEFTARAYGRAERLAAAAARRLLDRERYAAVVLHHGIYVPQGPVAQVARERGARVVTWNPAYRKRCFIFSHGDTYHHTLMDEPVAEWENAPWDDARERAIQKYLKSRRTGTRDWIWFHDSPIESLGEIAAETGVDFTRPVVGLLTNVIWDAQLHYPANAFPSMVDWMNRTIAYFAKRPELQLLIRVHPAEVRAQIASRQPVVEEILRAFPLRPANVFVIPPESRASTYAAMEAANAVLIYGTKTGVELATLGVRVIVAGEAWVRGKGLTMDARSADDYFRLLDRLPLPGRMPEEQVKRARRYAYHFFFRRMIPIDVLEPVSGARMFDVAARGLDALGPGRCAGLDVICRGILEGTPFVYPA